MKAICGLLIIFVLCLSINSDAENSRGSIVLLNWTVGGMTKWADPRIHSGDETLDETNSRYRMIARDAVSVAFDPNESPLFEGPQGRIRTVALFMGWSTLESGGYRRAVDYGVGNKARGDHDSSWCLMQIHLSEPDHVDFHTWSRVVMRGDLYDRIDDGHTGWGGEDLVYDRTKCFRAALHMLRESKRICRTLPESEQFSIYAGGNCIRGRSSSRERFLKAQDLFATRPTLTDIDVLQDLKVHPITLIHTNPVIRPQ